MDDGVVEAKRRSMQHLRIVSSWPHRMGEMNRPMTLEYIRAPKSVGRALATTRSVPNGV